MRRPPALVAIGNVLMSDDGVGPYALAVLDATYALPASLDRVDAGTPGLDLAAELAHRDAVLIVDSVSAQAAPGTIHLYDKTALLAKRIGPRPGPHAPALHDTLVTLELAGTAPQRVILVGVVPSRTDVGTHLTREVRDAIPRVIVELVRQLGNLGIVVAPRVPRGVPNLWWEKEVEMR